MRDWCVRRCAIPLVDARLNRVAQIVPRLGVGLFLPLFLAPLVDVLEGACQRVANGAEEDKKVLRFRWELFGEDENKSRVPLAPATTSAGAVTAATAAGALAAPNKSPKSVRLVRRLCWASGAGGAAALGCAGRAALGSSKFKMSSVTDATGRDGARGATGLVNPEGAKEGTSDRLG